MGFREKASLVVAVDLSPAAGPASLNKVAATGETGRRFFLNGKRGEPDTANL
ncbi:MAG: hypothetical protein K0Q63_2332 [Paenibacillus sp.]|nr:hypothetical protein [Paenibacillus sp.]